MAEQNEEHVALSIGQEDSTANTSNPAAESSGTANFSIENGHPKTDDNPADEVVLTYLDYFVIVIIAIIVVIAIPVFVLVIAPIIAIMVLPLLLALYFIAHLVQVFRTDDDKKLSKFMGALAKWLCFCFVVISIDLLLCTLIFGVTPTLKGRIVLDVPSPKDPKVHDKLSVTRFIGVLAIICVFLTYSMVNRYVLGYRRLKKEHSEEKTHLFEGLIGAINSLIYLLALFSVTRVAPILKEHTILGLPTYKWIKMILFAALGHRVISIFTSSIAVALHNRYFIKAGKEGLNKAERHKHTKWLLKNIERITGQATSTEEWIKYVVYYTEGLRRSFNFLLTSLLALLTWIIYFGSRLNRSSSHTVREVYDTGLWTLACILASAFLWLVKCGTILSLEDRLVYDKLYDQVSGAANQLYLIGIIAGPEFDILGVWKKEEGGDDDCDISAGMQTAKLKVRAKSKAREILVREEKKGILHASRVMRMARFFMDAEKPLSRDGYLSDFIEHFWKNNPQLIEGNKIRDLHGYEIDEVDYKLFEKQLEEEGCKMEDIDKWMMTNHKVCLKIGRTLAGAMEVVDCLNNTMIIILVTAVTIVWLLITGIATTRVLVLIASPIVTASFIFGESAKTWFQGLMFIYVVHPFDVGDLCTIKNVQVEVKRIDVWKTKFSKVGTTDDEVVYPNTILAMTSFVNHSKKVDPNDHVELRLSSATSMEQIKKLKSKIEKYMANDKVRFNKHPDGVLVKDIGKTIGISVYFKHDEESIKATMPTDALQKKTQRRNEFLVQVKTFLEELDIGESRKPQLSVSKSVGHKTRKQQASLDRRNSI